MKFRLIAEVTSRGRRRYRGTAVSDKLGPVHTNLDASKTAYLSSRIRVDGASKHSGERFKKYADSLSADSLVSCGLKAASCRKLCGLLLSAISRFL